VRVDERLTSTVSSSFRAARVLGMFDLPTVSEQVVEVRAELPLEDADWTVGAIVGASGSGKSTIARALWPDQVAQPSGFTWKAQSLVDDFPAELSPDAVAGLLTSVGLSSAPVWLRPYRVLSTGQQFRASLARALAAGGAPVVFDEFTSVVDRTVAKAASVAVAKHCRRAGTRFVAVTCHRDVLPWLEADWVYDTDRGVFDWTRGCLRRPPVRLCVRAGSRDAWPLFRGHHYLSRDLAGHARVFLAYVELDGEERLAGFFSVLPRLLSRGSTKDWLQGHRIVVLPDMQGLGIGNRMVEAAAEQLWVQERVRYVETSSAPGFIQHRRRHPAMWRLERGPSMKAPSQSRSRAVRTSAGRLTTTWVYVPEALRA
jgi:ABC-type polar amino acid transport system ATPase subunit/GNAT superfamily N-acetyltransferase